MFLQSAVRLVWLVDYLVRNSFYNVENPHLLVSRLPYQHIDQSYRTALNIRLIIYMRIALPLLHSMFVFVFVLFFFLIRRPK